MFPQFNRDVHSGRKGRRARHWERIIWSVLLYLVLAWGVWNNSSHVSLCVILPLVLVLVIWLNWVLEAYIPPLPFGSQSGLFIIAILFFVIRFIQQEYLGIPDQKITLWIDLILAIIIVAYYEAKFFD
jgi:hypothetical protein